MYNGASEYKYREELLVLRLTSASYGIALAPGSKYFLAAFSAVRTLRNALNALKI
jgi:hypothetical protein